MKIRLDISTICQLKCPLCPNSSGKFKNTPTKYGVLSFDKFKNFIDENLLVQEIEISNYGEVFLNKDLSKILEYANQKGIFITILNGTNLNTATREQLKNVVKFKVKKLNVSIDGATQQTYATYRVNGILTNVIKNIEIINEYKKKFNSEYPLLIWQYVAFSYNIHEIEKAQLLADQLNMKFNLKENWDLKNRITLDPQYSKLIENIDLHEIENNTVLDKNNFYICLQMWERPQINWNGEVLGCCVNYWETYGNAFSEGLNSVLNNEKYKNTQKLLLGKTFGVDSPCLNCGFFRTTVIKMNWKNYLKYSPLKFLFFSLKQFKLYNLFGRKLKQLLQLIR